MTIRKLEVSPDVDLIAQQLAGTQGVRVETFLERKLDESLRNARGRLSLFVWRTFRWWIKPLVTAALVIVMLSVAHELSSAHGQGKLFLTLLHWLRVAGMSFFPWPFTAIVIVSVIFASPYAFGNLIDLIGTFRKVKFAGTEIELNERTKSKLLAATNDIQDAIGEYKARVDDEVARLVSRRQMDSKLARFSDEVIIARYGRQQVGAGYRCTIHIPDPIADDKLYQLLSYHPAGGGEFRTFSDRYGIIGKVWRTEKSLFFNDIAEHLPAGASAEEKLAYVMANWGMSRREAERALTRPSCICLLLERNGEKVGILFVDSNIVNAFPNTTEQLIDGFRRAAATVRLAESCDEIIDELSSLKLGLNLSS